MHLSPSEPALPITARPKSGSRFRLWLNVALILVVIAGLTQTIRLAVNDLRNSDQKIDAEISELLSAADQAASIAEQASLRDRAEQLRSRKFSLANLNWGIVLLAIPLSMLGILGPGLYWFWVLNSLSIHVPLPTVARAYYVGNLGKYVPGKAMVLILRAAALRPFGATVPLTFVSVFVETLTTIAIGAAVGVVALSQIDVPPWLHLLAWLSAIIAVTPTLPPIFVPLLQTRLGHDSVFRARLRSSYNWKFMLRGWALSFVGWIILGSGLYCVVASMPILSPTPLAISQDTPVASLNNTAAEVMPLATARNAEKQNLWVVCIAACSLSVVAGFVSLLPGGAGVRELVLTILLSPLIGTAAALIAAVIHRLVTIVGELLLAGIGILVARVYAPRPQSANVPSHEPHVPQHSK